MSRGAQTPREGSERPFYPDVLYVVAGSLAFAGIIAMIVGLTFT